VVKKETTTQNGFCMAFLCRRTSHQHLVPKNKRLTHLLGKGGFRVTFWGEGKSDGIVLRP